MKGAATLLTDLLLVLATVTDVFLAALSYGSGGIRIPFSSNIIICSINTLMLSLAVCLSHTLSRFISTDVCTVISCTMLFAIGSVQFFQKGLKSFLKKHSGSGKLSFRFLDIGFVISVYIDETQADLDKSKILSPREAVSLAVAVGIDAVSGGIGAGFSEINVLRVSLLSIIFCILSVSLGGVIGRKINRKGRDMGWVSGVFLMVLAAVKLF